MAKNRLLGVAFISAVIGLIAIACGGDPTTSSPATSQPTQTPIATSAPTAAAPAATAAAGPPATEAPRGDEPQTSTSFIWDIVQVDDEGAKPSLAVDSSGTPHIAFMAEAMPGFIKHAVLIGPSEWRISTVDTGYFYGPLDIKVDEAGVPSVVWHDHDNEDGAFAKLSGDKWDVSRIRNSGHDGWDISVALDSNGDPHVASIDPAQFGGRSGFEYAVFDGQNWTVEEVGSGPLPYEFGTGLAIDSQDRPHVVWFDAQSEGLKYAVRESGSWNISDVDTQGDVGRYANLALDQQDNPVVSYYEVVDTTSGYIKVARWDGAQWLTERVDKLDNVVQGFFGARKTGPVVVSPEGNPIVAYSDEALVKVAAWDGNDWNIETVTTAEGDPLGQQVSLGLDPQGVLHLTFADARRKAGPGVIGNVMYARGIPNGAANTTTSPQSSETAQATAAPEQPAAPVASLNRIEPDPNWEAALSNSSIRTFGWETDFSRHTVPYSEFLSGGPPRDGIAPLDEPSFVSPGDAHAWLDPSEPVIAFELNGDRRAYPLQIMTWHEIVNDVVGGVPVTVTFCPLCNSAIAFERTLDGVVYDFGTSGNLRHSDLVMWDRQTESWWQQLTGEAVVGALAGNRLSLLPAAIVSWEDFRAASDDGQVLSRDTGFDRRYGTNPYSGYDRADNPPFLFRGDLDGRLLPKERVAAVSIGDIDAAFPFAVLETERVVNYSLDGADLVVLFKPGTRSALDRSVIIDSREIGAAAVFDPHLNGQKLTFQIEDDQFKDVETGSTWNILGTAVDGPLAGEKLTQIVHGDHFWFAWAAFRPDTKIYQAPG